MRRREFITLVDTARASRMLGPLAAFSPKVNRPVV